MDKYDIIARNLGVSASGLRKQAKKRKVVKSSKSTSKPITKTKTYSPAKTTKAKPSSKKHKSVSSIVSRIRHATRTGNIRELVSASRELQTTVRKQVRKTRLSKRPSQEQLALIERQQKLYPGSLQKKYGYQHIINPYTARTLEELRQQSLSQSTTSTKRSPSPQVRGSLTPSSSEQGYVVYDKYGQGVSMRGKFAPEYATAVMLTKQLEARPIQDNTLEKKGVKWESMKLQKEIHDIYKQKHSKLNKILTFGKLINPTIGIPEVGSKLTVSVVKSIKNPRVKTYINPLFQEDEEVRTAKRMYERLTPEQRKKVYERVEKEMRKTSVIPNYHTFMLGWGKEDTHTWGKAYDIIVGKPESVIAQSRAEEQFLSSREPTWQDVRSYETGKLGNIMTFVGSIATGATVPKLASSTSKVSKVLTVVSKSKFVKPVLGLGGGLMFLSSAHEKKKEGFSHPYLATTLQFGKDIAIMESGYSIGKSAVRGVVTKSVAKKFLSGKLKPEEYYSRIGSYKPSEFPKSSDISQIKTIKVETAVPVFEPEVETQIVKIKPRTIKVGKGVSEPEFKIVNKPLKKGTWKLTKTTAEIKTGRKVEGGYLIDYRSFTEPKSGKRVVEQIARGDKVKYSYSYISDRFAPNKKVIQVYREFTPDMKSQSMFIGYKENKEFKPDKLLIKHSSMRKGRFNSLNLFDLEWMEKGGKTKGHRITVNKNPVFESITFEGIEPSGKTYWYKREETIFSKWFTKNKWIRKPTQKTSKPIKPKVVKEPLSQRLLLEPDRLPRVDKNELQKYLLEPDKEYRIKMKEGIKSGKSVKNKENKVLSNLFKSQKNTVSKESGDLIYEYIVKPEPKIKPEKQFSKNWYKLVKWSEVKPMYEIGVKIPVGTTMLAGIPEVKTKTGLKTKVGLKTRLDLKTVQLTTQIVKQEFKQTQKVGQQLLTVQKVGQQTAQISSTKQDTLVVPYPKPPEITPPTTPNKQPNEKIPKDNNITPPIIPAGPMFLSPTRGLGKGKHVKGKLLSLWRVYVAQPKTPKTLEIKPKSPIVKPLTFDLKSSFKVKKGVLGLPKVKQSLPPKPKRKTKRIKRKKTKIKRVR